MATAILFAAFVAQGTQPAEALLLACGFVVPCAALGWAVWSWLQTGTTTGPLAGASMLRHVGLALAFSLAWTASFVLFTYLVRGYLSRGPLGHESAWQLVWGLLVYAAILAAARLRLQVREREEAALRAELQALRAQINPHFMFNTLHSLGQLAAEDVSATQQAIERFGALMRHVLEAARVDRHEVPLEEELRFVRDYLELERLRLGGRLVVVETVEDDALECVVPVLLMQPLVENAIRHGIAPLRKGGTVRICARLNGECLEIEVSDDGLGARPEAPRRATGLGLRTVERLLAAQHGDRARMDIDTGEGRGFHVRLRLPARLEAPG
jgi:LytS/YehU family sensor histidine kinase